MYMDNNIDAEYHDFENEDMIQIKNTSDLPFN